MDNASPYSKVKQTSHTQFSVLMLALNLYMRVSM